MVIWLSNITSRSLPNSVVSGSGFLCLMFLFTYGSLWDNIAYLNISVLAGCDTCQKPKYISTSKECGIRSIWKHWTGIVHKLHASVLRQDFSIYEEDGRRLEERKGRKKKGIKLHLPFPSRIVWLCYVFKLYCARSFRCLKLQRVQLRRE